MTTTTKQSKKALLTSALIAGENFTAKQITRKFGIANPTATISEIRYGGVPVFANSSTKSDGTKVTVYRSGKAPRAVVAAGYRALKAQGVAI